MRQMMSMGGSGGAGGDADAQYVTASGYPGGVEVFRSESPAAFTGSPQPFTASPGIYSSDLPAHGGQYDSYGHQHQQHHAQTVPAQFGDKLYVMDSQFAPGGGEYYTHPQHVSTI
jgi:hypothetical protein